MDKFNPGFGATGDWSKYLLGQEAKQGAWGDVREGVFNQKQGQTEWGDLSKHFVTQNENQNLLKESLKTLRDDGQSLEHLQRYDQANEGTWIESSGTWNKTLSSTLLDSKTEFTSLGTQQTYEEIAKKHTDTFYSWLQQNPMPEDLDGLKEYLQKFKDAFGTLMDDLPDEIEGQIRQEIEEKAEKKFEEMKTQIEQKIGDQEKKVTEEKIQKEFKENQETKDKDQLARDRDAKKEETRKTLDQHFKDMKSQRFVSSEEKAQFQKFFDQMKERTMLHMDKERLFFASKEGQLYEDEQLFSNLKERLNKLFKKDQPASSSDQSKSLQRQMLSLFANKGAKQSPEQKEASQEAKEEPGQRARRRRSSLR